MTLQRFNPCLAAGQLRPSSNSAAPGAIAREAGNPSGAPAKTPHDGAGLERATREARTALREAASAAAVAAEHARSVAAALDEALAVLATANAPSRRAPTVLSPSTDWLTAREREVLALVAEGRSNKAIAAALFVSPNTVKTHVASLLHKLDAANRAQLAALANTYGDRHRRTATTRAAEGS